MYNKINNPLEPTYANFPRLQTNSINKPTQNEFPRTIQYQYSLNNRIQPQPEPFYNQNVITTGTANEHQNLCQLTTALKNIQGSVNTLVERAAQKDINSIPRQPNFPSSYNEINKNSYNQTISQDPQQTIPTNIPLAKNYLPPNPWYNQSQQ